MNNKYKHFHPKQIILAFYNYINPGILKICAGHYWKYYYRGFITYNKILLYLGTQYFFSGQVRPPHTQTAVTPKKKLLVPVIIISLALVLGVIGSEISEYFNTSNIDNLKSTMRSLKNEIPSLQQSILNKLGGALLRLEKPGEPIVFMLLHDDTNKKTTDCLVSHASHMAKKYIFTNSKKSLWMNGSEWTSYSDFDHEDLLYKKVYNI